MIDFQRLDLEQKARYDAILRNCGQRGCEYSFVNLFLWGRQKAAFLGERLAILSQFNRKCVYPFPVGKGDLKEAIDTIIHDAQTRGQTHAGEDGVQQDIVGDLEIAHQLLDALQDEGVDHGAEGGVHGEFLAQDQPAHAQHGDVEHEDEHRQGNVEQMLHHQADAGGAAADQVGRQQEKGDGGGVDGVAENDAKGRKQPAVSKILVCHNCTLPKKIRLSEIFPNRRGSRRNA